MTRRGLLTAVLSVPFLGGALRAALIEDGPEVLGFRDLEMRDRDGHLTGERYVAMFLKEGRKKWFYGPGSMFYPDDGMRAISVTVPGDSAIDCLPPKAKPALIAEVEKHVPLCVKGAIKNLKEGDRIPVWKF